MTPRPHGSVMGDVRLKAATELRLLAKATDETGFARVGPPSLERIADELEAASQSPESAAPVGGTGVRQLREALEEIAAMGDHVVDDGPGGERAIIVVDSREAEAAAAIARKALAASVGEGGEGG